MRVLLGGMVLLSMVGCDSLWASYIGMGDFGLDGGPTCSGATGCADMTSVVEVDLALPTPPDMTVVDPGHPACATSTTCPTSVPVCDQNSGTCVAGPLSAEAFPSALERTFSVGKRYELMATGDFNGDGFTDIAVSGLFSGGIGVNATTANIAAVEIYNGDGQGGFAATPELCSISGESPVAMLTVGPAGSKKDLLVAGYGQNIYRCTRGTTWSAPKLNQMTGAMDLTDIPSGFKQLALASHTGRMYPDLVIRTGKNLFLEPTPPKNKSRSGEVDVHRTGANYVFIDVPSIVSDTDIAWLTATPYQFPTNNLGDSMAVTWDSKNGVNFQYIDGSDTIINQNFPMTPPSGLGAPLTEFVSPLITTALVHASGGKAPSLLYVLSQKTNLVTVLGGTTISSFSGPNPISLTPSGVVLPYAGDADGDGQDELGLYTLQLPSTNMNERSLQLLSFKAGTINTTPIVTIPSTTENFRAMSLEYLGSGSDRRVARMRKDLIVLMEDPGGNSRVLIRRANLNYTFP